MGPELCSELVDEFREGRSVRADLDGERILAYGTLCNDSFKYLRPKQPTKKTYVCLFVCIHLSAPWGA